MKTTRKVCYDPLCEIHNKSESTDEEIAREAAAEIGDFIPYTNERRLARCSAIILAAIKKAKE